jgi:predicted regulator of Ras-like GTPase activity (Roadblock/LC7/MglB family)
MAVPFKLPRLPQTAPSHQQFQVYWQRVVTALEQAINDIQAVQAAQAAAIAAIEAAQAAADAANAAAAVATTAAADANQAITDLAAGDFEVTAINVGGTRFINNGAGGLEEEP